MIIYDRLSLIALAAKHPDWFISNVPIEREESGATHLKCEAESSNPYSPELYERGIHVGKGSPSKRCVECEWDSYVPN